ncbi:MAG: hypothetical protein ACR2P2_02225 [Nakamurella sp.]
MSTELELRLIEASAPDGEIRLSDLAEIARTLQELSLRIGRQYADAGGPGRTHHTIEDLSQLRLTGLAAGSTRLVVARGELGELDAEFPEVAELDRRFWDVIEGIGSDRRPEWVSDLVADSAAGFLAALQVAAPRVVASMGAGRQVDIDTHSSHAATWVASHTENGEEAAVAGRLEKVDLRSHTFRIRDDVGNTLQLKDVPNDGLAARLIGGRVLARGAAIRNRSGALTGLRAASVAADEATMSWQIPAVIPIEKPLASAPGPSAVPAVELSDDEFAAFLEAIRS